MLKKIMGEYSVSEMERRGKTVTQPPRQNPASKPKGGKTVTPPPKSTPKPTQNNVTRN